MVKTMSVFGNGEWFLRPVWALLGLAVFLVAVPTYWLPGPSSKPRRVLDRPLIGVGLPIARAVVAIVLAARQFRKR